MRIRPRLRLPRRPRLRGRRGGLLLAIALVLALLQLTVLAPTPVSDGPRPPLTDLARLDRWVPPSPNVDARFATFSAVGPEGEPGLWLVPTSRVPVRFTVEEEVLERFGSEALEEAFSVFDDVAGSRFGAELTARTAAGVNERRRDGVNRVFLDRRSCGERYLARAHLWSEPLRVRDRTAVRYVTEVDVGVCERLTSEWLAPVIRHELAHIAGLDHLCDAGEDCHDPAMDDDNTCRIMSRRLHSCQRVTRGDLDGLVHLHPRLPRVGGGSAQAAAARAVRTAYPGPRSSLRAVVTPHDASQAQRLVGATLAGLLDAPHVLVDEGCTAGSDGEALNRAVALTGDLVAVGELPSACATVLEDSWDLRLETLPDATAVVDHLVEREAAPPTRVVVAPRPVDEPGMPLAATAAAGAVALEAPLLVLGANGEVGQVLRVLEEHPTIREVVVVGDLRHTSTRVMAALDDADVALRRLWAEDAQDVTRALLSQPELAGQGPYAASVVAEQHPQQATAAVTLASALGGLVVPVGQEPGMRELALLGEAAFDRGGIIGGTEAVGEDLKLRLSRALDGEAEDERTAADPGERDRAG